MATAKEVVISIQDADGHASQTSVRIPSATLAADATAFASDIATLCDAVIDGVITRVGISETVTLPGGLKAAVLDNADVEVGATIFYNAVGGFTFRHRLPTWRKDKLITDGSGILIGNADVDAWIAMMVSGITPVATLVQPSEWRDADITSLIKGSQTFTKTR